jgi:hypothetical protein
MRSSVTLPAIRHRLLLDLPHLKGGGGNNSVLDFRFSGTFVLQYSLDKRKSERRTFLTSLKPQASSLKPQASSLKPQASSLKPQASSLKPLQGMEILACGV